MEEGDSILDAIYDEDYNLDDDDVDMIDVEEGEFVEPNSPKVFEQSSAGDITEANQESRGKTSKSEASKKKKKKNKKRKRNGSGSGSNVMNIDRFVLDTCRHLKEKKSYMVYTAVGCLGIPALSDIIKEVDAIQACGGQKTVDGRRFRSGGGILWNIIKVREPKVHKEIMKRAKEFEKQFRQPNAKQLNVPKQEDSSQGVTFSSAGSDQGNVSDRAFLTPEMQNQHETVTSKEKSISVHARLRIPVSYDDDLLGANPVNDAT